MRPVLILVLLLVLPGCTRWPDVRASAAAAFQPSDPGERYDRARHQLAMGNTALALEEFRALLRQNPRSLPALNGLAVAYDRLRRFDVSRTYYEQALGLDPTAPVTLNNFGTSLLLQGRLAEAQPLLERAATGADAAVSARAQANLAQLRAARATASRQPVHQAAKPSGMPADRRIGRLGPATQVLLTSSPSGAERR